MKSGQISSLLLCLHGNGLVIQSQCFLILFWARVVLFLGVDITVIKFQVEVLFSDVGISLFEEKRILLTNGFNS